jgi:hypothetical protein
VGDIETDSTREVETKKWATTRYRRSAMNTMRNAREPKRLNRFFRIEEE